MRHLFLFSIPALMLTFGVGGRLAAQSPTRPISFLPADPLALDRDSKEEQKPEAIGTTPVKPAPAKLEAAPGTPAATEAVEDEDGADGGGMGGAGAVAAPAKAPEAKPFWAVSPPVEKFPRPGWFPLGPTGPGYYSLADVVHGEYRKGPPKYPYPRFSIIPFPFFYADWRYLDDPKNEEHDCFDCLKRIHWGENWMFTTGGEVRLRYNNEVDSRLTGKDNTYYMERTRVYGDLWYQDKFRVFVEGIDARSWNQDLPPLVIDQNHFDFQNLFVDAKLCCPCGDPLYLRVGRQELLYG